MPSTTRPARRPAPASGSPTRTPRRSTEKALDALELAPEPDRSRRLELLLELGSEQTKAARQAEARRALEQAAALARELDRPEELARAALGICLLSVAGVVDEDLIDLLTEALEPIGPEDSPLRSQLLSGLAQELYWVDAAGRSNDLGLEALEMARRLDDPDALALALVRRQFTGTVGPEQVRRRLRESKRAARPGQARGDRELELRAHVYRLPAGSSSARSAGSTPSSPRSSGWRPSCASRPTPGTCRCCGRCGR